MNTRFDKALQIMIDHFQKVGNLDYGDIEQSQGRSTDWNDDRDVLGLIDALRDCSWGRRPNEFNPGPHPKIDWAVKTAAHELNRRVFFSGGLKGTLDPVKTKTYSDRKFSIDQASGDDLWSIFDKVQNEYFAIVGCYTPVDERETEVRFIR